MIKLILTIITMLFVCGCYHDAPKKHHVKTEHKTKKKKNKKTTESRTIPSLEQIKQQPLKETPKEKPSDQIKVIVPESPKSVSKSSDPEKESTFFDWLKR